MRPRTRIFKVVKWGSTLLTVAFAVTFATTARSWSEFEVADRYTVSIGRGCCSFRWKLDDGEYGAILRPGPNGLTFAVGRHFYPGCAFGPLWPAAVPLLLISAGAWGAELFGRGRRQPNACPHCQYDRSGLAPCAVCPECGRALKASGQ
jgi:hypothetical protein